MNFKILSNMLNVPEKELEIIFDTMQVMALFEIMEKGETETLLGSFSLKDNKLVLNKQSDYVNKILIGKIEPDDIVRRFIHTRRNNEKNISRL